MGCDIEQLCNTAAVPVQATKTQIKGLTTLFVNIRSGVHLCFSQLAETKGLEGIYQVGILKLGIPRSVSGMNAMMSWLYSQ